MQSLFKTRINSTPIVFRLLISLVAPAPEAVNPPHILPLAHALQHSILSDNDIKAFVTSLRAADIWLAHFRFTASLVRPHTRPDGVEVSRRFSSEAGRGSSVGGLN